MWFYSWMALLFAQEVQLSIDSNQIIVGVPTVLTVLATGFEEEPMPEVGEFAIQGRNRESVRVDFLGVDPMVSRQTSIINGRRTDSVNVRYAYRYRLMVDKEGDYQIPTVQVTQGDVSATSSPGRFSVREAPTTPEMSIELDIPKDTVWVGQTIPLNIDLYLQRDIGDLQVVVPLFDEFPVQPQSDVDSTQEFDLSTVHGDIRLPIVQERVQRGNQEYTRVRMKAQTTLTKAGKVEVAPSRILAQMVVGQQRGMLGFSRNQYQLFQAKDSPKQLDVRPLPLKDKPDSFSGAVGESFSMSIRANKTVVAVGEPIPIELEVRGKGALSGIQLPSFEALGFDERIFETPTQSPLGIDNDQGGKVFTFSVRLKSADVREIPVLDFGYFDPKKGSYQHAYTQPLALSVSGSKVISAAQVVGGTQTVQSVSSNKESSLSTSAFDLSWSSQSASSLSNTPWFPITVTMHLLGIVVWFWQGWRVKTEGQRAERSSQKASKAALQQLLPRIQDQPAQAIGGELSLALRNFGREHEVDVKSIIQQVEIESYAPKAKSTPFSEGLRQSIQALITMLLGCVLLVHAPTAWADSSMGDAGFGAVYQQAMSLDSHVERQNAMRSLQQRLQQALQTDAMNGELWSNLGTVSIQVSDRGQAVLSYSKAQELGVDSPQIEQNLAAIEAQLPAWTQRNQRSVWEDVFFWTTLPVSVQWGLLNLFGLALIFGWRRSVGLRLLVLPWLAFAMGLGWMWLRMQEPLVVVMRSTPLRSADHAQAPLVRNEWLPEGAQATVLQTQTDWVQIQFSSGTQGWVEQSVVQGL